MSKLESLIQFLTIDIWRMNHDARAEKHGMWIAVFKKLYLAVQFFIDKGVMAAASALTYSTLLAIVPVVAVVFAIARGFGFNKYIEEWFSHRPPMPSWGSSTPIWCIRIAVSSWASA